MRRAARARGRSTARQRSRAGVCALELERSARRASRLRRSARTPSGGRRPVRADALARPARTPPGDRAPLRAPRRRATSPAIEQRLEPGGGGAAGTTADPPTASGSLLAFGAHHELAARARADRPVAAAHADRRRPLDGPRPGRRRGLALLRRPRRGRAPQAGLDARRRAGAASTSAARRGAWCGCSPPRYPEIDWHGCDPIPDAIEWARRASARASPSSAAPSTRRCPMRTTGSTPSSRSRSGATSPRAPRSTGCGRCDASSSPGGRLLITTHGEQTIAHTRRRGRPLAEQLDEIQRRSDEHGFWYAAEFGEAGDHGVANADWGTAFLSAEWLLAKLTPEWERRRFRARPGRGRTRTCTCSSAASGGGRSRSSIPVKDGGPLLEPRARGRARARASSSCVVIDSGSRDGSRRDRARGRRRADRDRAGGVRPRPHAQPRRRAHVRGADLLPDPGRRAGSRAGSTPTARRSRSTRAWARRSARTCRAPDTSPMIARELTEFFAGFSPNGAPVLQRAGRPHLPLERERLLPARVLGGDPLRRRGVLRGPGLRPRHARGRLGRRSTTRGAAVLHAHDYGPVEFMRRYFDEYRGLRETSGHVEPLAAARGRLREVRARRCAGCASRAGPRAERARWAARSAVAPRRPQGGLRARLARRARCPGRVQRALSLEGRGGHRVRAELGLPRGRIVSSRRRRRRLRGHRCASSREGAAPLDDPVPGMADRPLHIAVVIPPFARGSGGHSTIFTLLARLEEMGHTCSVWIHDPRGDHCTSRPAVLRRRIVEEFAPLRGAGAPRASTTGTGADVVARHRLGDRLPRRCCCPGCRARAYLVQDHEPEFFATSARVALGRAHLRARPLPDRREPLAARPARASATGCAARWFRLGVDHGIYRPPPGASAARDTVIFYARESTPRRAVPLGAARARGAARGAARDALRAVRPRRARCQLPFAYEQLGVATPELLALALRGGHRRASACRSRTTR